ncbi:DUF2058 domain-containing protein [Psychrobium sp. 1_MG-2023]|uniref:DUF2058 domain-containing protein n=1 Tax=Psychrobium sp. 1_MG-2023 TaxID=3062624 RepID=UPI000C3434D9|nr:DUF2058 domain-containing protein [Psychrobium sp. 1_MG-2023]MDP2560588.1 DUF2058 domain-containing protein [Psychrobium sp. 1_MG-2023]PKF57636.1 DUF2058 domain-containing protein [Alteromonadales bacterium alter-6D02]
MASLQDQLLKAGLANKQSAKQIRSEKRKKNKAVRKNQTAEDTSLQDQLAQQKQQQAEQDLARNQAIKAELERKSELGKVKQMIEQLHIKEFAGDNEYNYVLDNKVKTILLDDINHNALVKGRISICTLNDAVYLMPSQAAEKIAAVDESYVLLMNDNQPTEVDEDDPYADFQIPDDLMW